MLKQAIYCSFLVGMVQYPVALYAQKKLDTRITVPNSAIRVDALFDLFSKEADLEFSINSKRINLAQMIYVTHHSQTVTGWLEDLSVATGISYKIKGDHVILEDQKTIALPVKLLVSGEEEKAVKKEDHEEEEKYKEGLITLIKEDLHTVYGPEEKTKIDRSIHPSVTEKPIVSDSSKPAAPPFQALVKVDIGFAGVAVGTERRMGQKMTIDLSVGLGGEYDLYNHEFKYHFPGDPMVFLSINPRYYYNRNKRAAAGRKTTLNAGSYIGFRLKLNLPLDGAEAYLANIHWGIQIPIARKWLFNGHAGIGYGVGSTEYFEWKDKGMAMFYPALECRISYVLNKPRR
jgi:hypothetical protein